MKNLHRFSDWEERLRTYLDRVAEEPFQWGTHDCALFAASAVNAMTGTDPAAKFRERYDDVRGAALALREVGAGTLAKTAEAWFGPGASIHHAKRGDLVMRNKALGVCVGRYSWFVGREQGLERLVPVPTNDCQHAYTIPFGPASE